MKTLNKSLLTAAVIGAIALPGLTSAATLNFVNGQQITFARELIVNNGTTIHTPHSLLLTAQATDATRVNTVTAADHELTVKVTLTNGARFDSSADAPTLVAGFIEGVQTGGSGQDNAAGRLDGGPAGPTRLVGTPYYSNSGQELNFTYKTRDKGDSSAAGFFLQLNSAQITNLVQSLGSTGGEIAMEITVQNQNGQPILSQRQVVARSVWGLTIADEEQPAADRNKRIDVGSAVLRKSLFSPSSAVGASDVGNDDHRYFNAGGFVLSVTKAQLTGGTTTDFINNFNAVASQPYYNILSTASFTVTVNGSNLSAFAGGRAWLSSDQTCGGTTVGLNIADASPDVATTLPIAADHDLFINLTNASPGTATVYVCLGTGLGTNASPFREMVPQTLSGSVALKHLLTTQRIDPSPLNFELAPLQQNGSTYYFQNVNPAGNTTAESFLRLTNHNGRDCPVVIDAKDDNGRHSGEVLLTVNAHESEQLNINVLESGNDSRFAPGSGFRNGAGKWYVRVIAECTNFTASALNRNSTTGVVTDLTPQRDEFGDQWSVDLGNRVP